MKKKVLAISSSGGHWIQLMRLRPAWDDCKVVYVTTEKSYQNEVLSYTQARELPKPKFYTTVHATRWQKAKLLRQLMEILWILVKERPDVIVSTGAASGFFALKLGKLLGAKTIWIDSIANVYQMSMAGKKAETCADVWLTQWQHLTEVKEGKRTPDYWGRVL